MLEVTRELARFVNDLKFENIPTEVIDLKDGRQISRQVHLPKGEFGNFLTNFELRAKFRSLVTPCIGHASEIALCDLIMNFDNETVDHLFHETIPTPGVLMAGED